MQEPGRLEVELCSRVCDMDHQPHLGEEETLLRVEAEYLVNRFCDLERVDSMRRNSKVKFGNFPQKNHVIEKEFHSIQPETHERQPDDTSVQVAVRIRPVFSEHPNDACIQLLSNHEDNPSEAPAATNQYQTIQVGENESSQNFTFDHAFPQSTDQIELYSTCVNPLVHSCLEGYNGTVFAYGQTGSGKTHTMIGEFDPDHRLRHDEVGEMAGVIPRALNGIFAGLEEKVVCQQEKALLSIPQSPQRASVLKKPAFEYHVKVQFLEIYGDEILDLVPPEDSTPKQSTLHDLSSMMNGRKTKSLSIRDGKAGEDAEVIGINQAKVESVEEALEYLRNGMQLRRTEKTAMNAVSSRSHAIFTLLIQQTHRKDSVPDDTSGKQSQRKNMELVEMKTSKIHFVDLAGSERIKSSKTEGKRLQEGININKGLFILGNVISALGNRTKNSKAHVPYRDSKLTRLLKGSLGGNHKTLMIACVSPSNLNIDESTNTLRYANRAKSIKNHAKVNIDPSSRVVNELRDQVTTLAKELLRLRNNDNFDEEECAFSEEFLEKLVHSTSNSMNSLPSRPVTAPPIRMKRSKNNKFPVKASSLGLPGRTLLQRPCTAPISTDKIPVQTTRNPLRRSRSFERNRNFEEDTPSLESSEGSDKESNHDVTKEGDYYSQDVEQIALYDQMCARLRETMEHVKKIHEPPTEVTTIYSSDEYSEFPLVSSATDTTSSSEFDLDEFLYSKGPATNGLDNLAKTIAECRDGFQAIKIENEIKLIETKIENFEREKKYFESIIVQFKESSSYFIEFTKSIKTLQEEITKSKKARGDLIGALKKKPQKVFDIKRSNFTALTVEKEEVQSFVSIANDESRTNDSIGVLSEIEEGSELSIEMAKSVNTIEEEISKLETVRENIMSLSSMKKPTIGLNKPTIAFHKPPSTLPQPTSAFHKPTSATPPTKAIHKPTKAIHKPIKAIHKPTSALHARKLQKIAGDTTLAKVRSKSEDKKIGLHSGLILSVEDNTVTSGLSTSDSHSTTQEVASSTSVLSSSQASNKSKKDDDDSGRALRSVVLRYSSPFIKPFAPYLSSQKKTRLKKKLSNVKEESNTS